MYRRFRYWSRVALTLTLAALVTFNPAWAGRSLRGWFHKCHSSSTCCEVAACPTLLPTCSSQISSCCNTVILHTDANACCSTLVEPIATPIIHFEADSGCCGSSSEIQMESASPSVQLDSTNSVPTPAVENTIAPTMPDVSPSDDTSIAAPPAALAPTQAEKLADPIMETPKLEPAPETKLNDASVKEPMPTPESSQPEPVAPEQPPAANDVFPDTKPDQPSANDDDLFGDAEPEAPVVTPEPTNDPTTTTPPSDVAPQSEPSTTTPPSDDPFDIPAQPTNEAPADDFFEVPEQPASDAPADDLFDSSPATPSTSDDLFDDPAAGASSEPAPSPVTDIGTETTVASDDDLFGSSTTETSTPVDASTTSQSPAAAESDLFDTPSIPAADAEDDLFEPLPTETEKPVNTIDKKEAYDKLFSNNAIRTWRDNTGTFEVDASLAEIHSDYVRLLKTNGNYCKVPIRRLSVDDMKFVELAARWNPDGSTKMVSMEHSEL